MFQVLPSSYFPFPALHKVSIATSEKKKKIIHNFSQVILFISNTTGPYPDLHAFLAYE